jgi:hypothetical protein
MVIDATGRPIAQGDLVSRSLRRAEVIDTPIAKQVFDIIDAIWLQEGRIEEIRVAGEQGDATDEASRWHRPRR